MSSRELKQQELAEALALAAARLMRSCVNCTLFDSIGDRDFCTKHNARPPARVIVTGCDDYDDIPF